eukprot:287827-Heterocapsa_arctica.AAC.1
MSSIKRCRNLAQMTRKRPSLELGGPGTFRVRPTWRTSREQKREELIIKAEDAGPRSPSGRH